MALGSFSSFIYKYAIHSYSISVCVWCVCVCVQVKEILQEEEDLSEIVQLVGKVCIWHHLNAEIHYNIQYITHTLCVCMSEINLSSHTQTL